MCLDFHISNSKHSNKSLKVHGQLTRAQSWKCKVMSATEGDSCACAFHDHTQ